jgi:hypothetical protein
MERKILEELHDVLVKELLERIKSGTATPADLNVARSMLKDNHIDCVAVPESPLAKLALTMPFDDDKMDVMRSKAFGTG